jgi:Cdc6-like AAA superfamily ATPase
MEELDINKILKREEIYASIKESLITFEKNKHDLFSKKGIYIYGNPGSGKTTFVNNILKELLLL